MYIYVRPEHGDVLDLIDKAGLPVFSLIERRHGVRIAEVRQQIVAVALGAAEARVLKARAGAPALHITRQYFDAQDRMVMASVGLYPSDRFSHNTRFRIQHSDRKGFPMKPLNGVRVVSVEQFGAAPYGSMFLADLGAEVIKVENAAIGGDPARKTGPYLLGDDDSEYFQTWNMNKKSVTLDLRTPEGKAALRAPGDGRRRRAEQPARRPAGEDGPRLRGARRSSSPRSSACTSRPTGATTSAPSWPGYDYLMQAEAGLMHLTGEPDGPPTRIGAPSMIDHTTGLTAMVGLLAALVQARATGKGCDVDTCLFDAALHQLGYAAIWYLNEGYTPERQTRSAHFSVAPVQTLPDRRRLDLRDVPHRQVLERAARRAAAPGPSTPMRASRRQKARADNRERAHRRRSTRSSASIRPRTG